MSRLTLSTSIAFVVMLAGCDRQVDTEYQGDSLMRIRASVAIPLGLEGADLVPAIAFAAASPMRGRRECWRSDHNLFVEVGVTGDFPSNFVLDVFDPPPPEAMRQLEDGPAYAHGTVTALPRQHPEGLIVYPFDNEMFQAWADIDRDTCYVEDESGDYVLRSDPTVCSVVHACTLDGERCLHRELACEVGLQITDQNDCEVVHTSGDETLGVAGYSVNYWLTYFAGPVDAGTHLAELYGGGEPISAGYHLYRVDLPNQTPDECLHNAFMTGAERYNARHGTSWQWFELLASGPTAERTLEERDEFVCEYLQVIDETDCVSIHRTLEEVGAESISIELGALTGTSFM